MEAPVITTTPPAPAATAPLPAASPAAPPAPAASPSKPEPAGEAKAAEAVPAWTEIQDAILLGSKSQGKEWKAIAALVDGKGPKELKARYKELTATASKADDTTEGEATEDESNGKKKQKAKNGKGKEPTDKNEVNEDSGKKGKAKAKNDDGKRLKGILRTDDDSSNDPTFEGRSIIFLDEDGNLTAAEVGVQLGYIETGILTFNPSFFTFSNSSASSRSACGLS